jgi:hypothetical protein
MSTCKTRLRRLDMLPTLLPAGVIPRSYGRLIHVSTKMLQGGGKLSEGLTRMLLRTTGFPDGLYSEPCSCFSESVVTCGAQVITSLCLTTGQPEVLGAWSGVTAHKGRQVRSLDWGPETSNAIKGDGTEGCGR